MLLQKRWYFTLTPDSSERGFMRQQWPSWERAQEEAEARGGVAEAEMIELEGEPVKDAFDPMGREVLANPVATGKREYVFVDPSKPGETRVEYRGGDDYGVERRRQEAAVKEKGRGESGVAIERER